MDEPMERCPKCGGKLFSASRYITQFDVAEEDQEESGQETIFDEADIGISFCSEHGMVKLWIEEPADLWCAPLNKEEKDNTDTET